MSRYLVEQTAARLRERAARVALDGGQFPTESQLIKELEVSRTTVREAFSRLEAEGVLLRRHGTATAVNAVALQLGQASGDDDLAARWSDSQAEAHVLENSPILIEADIAELLDVGAAHPTRRVRRLWRANDTPIAYEIEHVVLPTWPMSLPSPDADLFELARELYLETVIWRVDSTDTRAAEEEDAELLDVAIGSPLLITDGVYVTSGDRRLAHVRVVQRPGVGPVIGVTTFSDKGSRQ